MAEAGSAGRDGSGAAGGEARTSRGVGRVLADRYTLRSELGHGGMGVVWRADDSLIGRSVAIKELRLPSDVAEEEVATYRGRVLREARNAGRLSDPATVTVFDVLNIGGSVYIVMELVEAPTLAQLIKRSGPLDPRQVADIGRQLLSGLTTAHAAGIVHRDVKPSNIMVLPSGRAKLTDFGIAHALDDPTVTSTGVMMGSPAYMAPERLIGQAAGPPSDLWSLGAALYYAVEGRGAYERDTTAATLHAVVHDVPYLTRCQGPLAAAIMGLLTPTPQGRITPGQVRPLFDAAVTMPPPQPQPSQQSWQGPATDTPSGGVPQQQGPRGSGPHQVNQTRPGMPPTRSQPMGPQHTGPVGTGPQHTGPVGTGPQHTGPQHTGPLSTGPHNVTGRRRHNPALLWLGVAVLCGACFGIGALTGNHVGGVKALEDPASQVTVLTYGTGGQVPKFALDTGACGSGMVAQGRSISEDSYVDCDSQHQFDVYGEVQPVETSASTGYPPSDALDSYAQHQCWLLANSKQVSTVAARTPLDYVALVPSQKTWGSADDENASRDVYCVLSRQDRDDLTGEIDVTDAS